MHIAVINLARAADRRRKMEKRFDALGMPFEILEATDGRQLTDAERALVDHDGRRRITPYPLSDNEIGCCISHCRAMKQILDSGKKMGAIIEDDVTLADELPRVLAAIEKLDIPFDIIDLHRVFKRGEIFIPCHALLPDNALGRLGYAHINAQGYVMSREGARKFLAVMPPFNHMVDKEMHRIWANGLDLYVLERPVVAHADEGHSYIDETREHDRPQMRARYPEADQLYWRMQRYKTRLSDSMRKRIAFHAMIRRDRKRKAG